MKLALRLAKTGCAISAFPVGLLAAFLLLIGPISPLPSPAVEPKPFPADFMKGITYESWWNGEFASEKSDQTLRQRVKPLGAN